MKLEVVRTEFFKNMMTLLSGSALAQLIPFLMLPILQKWFFSPDDFGNLALFTSLSMLLAQVAGFKYEFAIVNVKKERDAENILVGVVVISVLFSIFIGVALFLFPNFIAKVTNTTSIINFFYLIPLSVLFFSNFEILNYWNNRHKKFKTIAVGKVSKTLSAESGKLSLGYGGFSSIGLIFGRVFGEFISFMFLGIQFLRNDFKTFYFSSPKSIIKTLKENYRFPLYTMPSVFVGNLINLVFISLFTSYFGVGKAGLIGISVVYVSVAFGLISQSFSQVFYKELSDTQGKKALLKLYLGNAKYLMLISIIAVVIVQLIPSSWVSTLLGDQWVDLMPTLKILVFSYAVSFVSSSLSFIYMRVNKQKMMLIFDIIHLGMVAVSIYIGFHYYHTFEATLISYTVAQVVYYLFAIVIAIVFIKGMKEE